VQFEWDERKTRANEAKYGVSFALATNVFQDPRLVLAEDASHGGPEARYFAFGRVGAGVLTVRLHHPWRAGSHHRCRLLEKR
jgi:uncharacterized DUF497 family protein